MSNYVKKYNLGNIIVDLPYNSYIHELPLLSFSDYRNSVNISLVFNKKKKDMTELHILLFVDVGIIS